MYSFDKEAILSIYVSVLDKSRKISLASRYAIYNFIDIEYKYLKHYVMKQIVSYIVFRIFRISYT